jgi:predicted amidophosphoribosyltransferase
LVACHAAFAYVGAARELVARVKYRNDRSALRWLAWRTAACLEPVSCGTALLAWAPTTPGRRRQRGFDHAELLARLVARRLGLPMRRLLVRIPGPAQTGRSKAERARGPQFSPSPGLARLEKVVTSGARTKAPTCGSVILVDDVATTGATLAAAARVLHAAGVGEVRGLVAARTP